MKNVIFIENPPLYTKELEVNIQSLGRTVMNFNSAKDYLGSQVSDEYAIVVIDLDSSDVTVNDIKGIRSRYEISPIIAISENGSISEQIGATIAGADFYFRKSFGPEILSLVIRNNHWKLTAVMS